jgi:hypothetical protein
MPIGAAAKSTVRSSPRAAGAAGHQLAEAGQRVGGDDACDGGDDQPGGLQVAAGQQADRADDRGIAGEEAQRGVGGVVAEGVEHVGRHARVAGAGDREQPVPVPAAELVHQAGAAVRRHQPEHDDADEPHGEVDAGGGQRVEDPAAAFHVPGCRVRGPAVDHDHAELLPGPGGGEHRSSRMAGEQGEGGFGDAGRHPPTAAARPGSALFGKVAVGLPGARPEQGPLW